MLHEVFWEIHSDLPQEAPGSDKSTMRALSMIPGLPNKPDILDVGCGPGRQTMILAEHTGGLITAVDTHQPFLDEVRKRVGECGVAVRITTHNCSMAEMEFKDKSFDLIWSEGAIYIMGFQKGLAEWKQFLKPGGFIAVTELTWLMKNAPSEAAIFWKECYPGMKHIDRNLEIMKETGYTPIGHFSLPDSDWWDGYYRPLEKRIAMLREKYAGNQEIIDVLTEERAEIELFEKYSASYGYVFYIMQSN